MFPILFKLGPLTLHTYGLCVALAVYLGVRVAIQAAVRSGLPQAAIEESFYQLTFLMVICGLIGARLLYLIEDWNEFQGQWGDVLKIWQGGLVSYGGLIGAGLGFYWWHRKNLALSWRKVWDWIAPAIAWGHAVGRVGCFFAGCCYGAPTSHFWGVTFRDQNSLAPLNTSLHPTQLYEAFFLLCLGGYLHWQQTRPSDPRTPEGAVFAQYLLLYPMGRFLIEFFRNDGPYFYNISEGQLLSLIVLTAGIVFNIYIHKKPAAAQLILKP